MSGLVEAWQVHPVLDIFNGLGTASGEANMPHLHPVCEGPI